MQEKHSGLEDGSELVWMPVVYSSSQIDGLTAERPGLEKLHGTVRDASLQKYLAFMQTLHSTYGFLFISCSKMYLSPQVLPWTAPCSALTYSMGLFTAGCYLSLQRSNLQIHITGSDHSLPLQFCISLSAGHLYLQNLPSSTGFFNLNVAALSC
ncbi:hypothetical protein P7K49_028195 [Saguinus oedipus]|uniref:Uncharacterized protein n=1 Tax=Saguinus oedipus TaxID=9490 RepID=A0ABQ9UBL7_SAGOE|nr:hypothetical protein P7K49_028195 [Saguinus oedipus]